ncbi:MAG: VirB3 family type IV secretion system protein [Stellaceae bacterium]
MGLRRRQFFPSLHNRQLVLGAERKPAILVSFLCGGLAFLSGNIPSYAIDGGLWAVLIAVLRYCATKDEQFFDVGLRYLSFCAHYTGQSRRVR